MDKLKRKLFFLFDKLHISRNERIFVAVALTFVILTFSLSLFITEKYTVNQANYDAIYAEFQQKSAAISLHKIQEEKKYSGELISEIPEKQAALPAVSAVASSPININSASLSELKTLTGIGDAYAKRIIEYREANDGFKTVDELVNVKGIGKTRLANLKPYITVD